jgi:glycosyltransferase involved in cell wall biosynthesis
LNTSLSIVLPVHNAAERLADNVATILDVLPELTPQFELLIVDDGSTDETADIARDLATCYPQVHVVRHPIRLGLEEAIESGLSHTEGKVVFVGDEIYGLDPHDLHRLWYSRQVNAPANAVLTARGMSPARLVAKRIDKWEMRRPPAERTAISVQLLRRESRDESPSTDERQHRVDSSPADATRPNFLSKIRRFTLGQ